jgi:hypothetical protein
VASFANAMVFRVPAVSDSFYDELAESYHLIFDDWNAAIARQREVLAKLLPVAATGKRVLCLRSDTVTAMASLSTKMLEQSENYKQTKWLIRNHDLS